MGAKSADLQLSARVDEKEGGGRYHQIGSSGCELPLIGGREFFLIAVRRGGLFGADNVLAILRRANSAYTTKNLRKVLLGLEATSHGHIQHSRIGSPQQCFGALKPLAQNKLMRGFAG